MTFANTKQNQPRKREKLVHPGRVYDMAISLVLADPDQPRKSFDDAGIQRLADSIGKLGIQCPLLVREGLKGKFIIIDGERRYRAAKLAKLKTLPCLLTGDTSDDPALRVSQFTINNLREQLKPMEIARLLADLRKSHFATDNELAAHLDKSGLPAMTPKQIKEAIALVDLPDWTQAMIDAGTVTPEGAAKIKMALPYPEVLAALDKNLSHDVKWRGRVTARDVEIGLRNAFAGAGVELVTDAYRYGVPIAHFNPKVACKGCEHLVSVDGSKYCMNPKEFEKKNAEAKAAGLLPGGKKPDTKLRDDKGRITTPEKAAEQEAQAKTEQREKSLGEKLQEYLHAYLVRRIVAHMKTESDADIHEIDITDELLTWEAMRRPGTPHWAKRPAIMPYRSAEVTKTSCLESLFSAADLGPLKLHAAIGIAHELPWRETQVVCHQLWGADIEKVWTLDMDFLDLFRKAELAHLAVRHQLTPPEGKKTWLSLKASELKTEIRARADQVQRPEILQDIYSQVGEPYRSGGYDSEEYEDERFDDGEAFEDEDIEEAA